MVLLPQTQAWPDLPYDAWKDTCATLQLWTQIVGKVRLAHTPWLNHSWHVPLYVTARGLTTSPIPHVAGPFEMTFDFHDHVLRIIAADKGAREIALRPRTVADFQQAVMAALSELNIEASIDDHPCEIPNAVRFSEDMIHASYDGEFARRFWRVLAETDRVMKRFRTAFLGKCSPVHFFWGSFDLAVTRFSGRKAPLHPGGVPGLADRVVQEAYSHEVSSAGFWPGGDGMEEAVFYSYAYPEPDGFGTAQVMSAGAHYDATFHEFVLPYDTVRLAPDPDAALMAFLQSTYEAAANASCWDRALLECTIGRPRIARSV